MKWAPALLFAIAIAACAREDKPLSAAGEKLYALRGTIVSRDANDNTLRLDHEAIPGLMEAMTMDYSVRGAKVAQLPADGSRVTAKLHVTDRGYWITGVARVR